MVRYILHSFLILVMAQLANITGGVIMTELQRGQIQHEISSLATIDLTQKFQIPVLQDIPVTPTETVRLPERELTARVRRLSEGMLFPWEIAAENIQLLGRAPEPQRNAQNAETRPERPLQTDTGTETADDDLPF